MAHILVVDDERSMQEFLEILLQREGHNVVCCGSAREALVALEHDDFDLLISDIRMPGISGLELLDRVRELSPGTLVILITAHGSTESAVEAMKHGAYDYLTKPCSVDEIRLVVEKALEKQNLSSENQRLRRQLQEQTNLPVLKGKSACMEEVFHLVHQVASTRTNILITGESGTGKDLIARAIHALSDRKNGPFVAVSCGAIPENLLESELFGHVKGSFTGAISNKLGLFEVADGGTLFLDEVGEMPLALQVKVLRAIQDRTFKRVGGTSDVRVDVRIVCATNRVLEEEVSEGRFREDLFYRLNVIEVRLPPLRERVEDIPQLVHFFLRKNAGELNKNITKIAPAALELLERYRYPGNVRELENLIERAVTLTQADTIELSCLPQALLTRPEPAPRGEISSAGVDLDALLARYESELLREALEKAGGVKKRAASLLGISFRSFRYRLEKLGLDGAGSTDTGASS
ncbi:MAG: sigma-54-dependent Fis family transcriptional regulator [Deltaproteobacteria bacterium]|nr:MAG: sigma-54-dependent Fis family transcriptional regulator [Deltaproteobacteria bacterium]